MDELLGRQSLESPQEAGYQRPERIDSVRGRDENDDSNRESAEVLLMLQVLIRCQERVERPGRQLQQFAVPEPAQPIAATVRTS